MLDVTTILLILVFWWVVAALLSPLEALGWWAGWFGRDEQADAQEVEALREQTVATTDETIKHYVVYLGGIAGVGGESLLPNEETFLDLLEDDLDETLVLKDVFPYSVSNTALTGQRLFSWLWRFVEDSRMTGRGGFIGFLINFRNQFQVAVSADRRYGPIYNRGMASLIIRDLIRHGYPVGSGIPVTLIGNSGGGLFALGAAPYVKALINAPVYIIGIGGVMAGDPGITAVEHLWYLYGSKDRVQLMGPVLSPSRWRFLVNSRWNQARRAGRISLVAVGPMKHNGRGGYLDSETAVPDGRTHMHITEQSIVNILRKVWEPA